MTLYLDSSALLRWYLADEAGRDECVEVMRGDPAWVTSRMTTIEVRRNLARALSPADAPLALAAFDADLGAMALIEVDLGTCAIACDIAVRHGVRSLDAVHLASALRVASGDLTVLTFDVRQARAARALGLVVAGAG